MRRFRILLSAVLIFLFAPLSQASQILCKDLFIASHRFTIERTASFDSVIYEISTRAQMEEGEVLGLLISIFTVGGKRELNHFVSTVVRNPEAYDALIELFIFLRIYETSLQADATNVDAFFEFFRLISYNSMRIKKLAYQSGIVQELYLSQFDAFFVNDLFQDFINTPMLPSNILGLRNAFFSALENLGMSWNDFKYLPQFIAIDLGYLNSIVHPNRRMKRLIAEYKEVQYLLDNYFWGVVLYIESLERKTNLNTKSDFLRTQIEELGIRNQIHDQLLVYKTRVLEAIEAY